MIDKNDCEYTLSQGYGLRNTYGGTVIKVFGRQYATRLGYMRNGKSFRFSNPKYWIFVELSLWQKLKIMWHNEVRR